MAIETRYGTYITSQSVQRDAPAGEASLKHFNSAPRTVRDRVAMENGDSQTSTFFMARISTSAVLSLAGTVFNEAAGTDVTLDIGFADNSALGISGKTDILVDGQAIAAAGSFSLTKDVALSDAFKPVWELLGLSEDPKAQVDIVGTIGGADLSADAVIAWETDFTTY